MPIYRQHESTELQEIHNKKCNKILGIPTDNDGIFIALYVQLNEIWLRVFIQAGILFVDECDGPDPEDDLDDNEEYVDISLPYDDQCLMVKSAVMKDGVFQIVFSEYLKLSLAETESGTKLKIS